MIGKYTFIFFFFFCAVPVNYVAVGDNSVTQGMDKRFMDLLKDITDKKCIQLSLGMKDCLKDKGLTEGIKIVTSLFTPLRGDEMDELREDLTDEVKCGLFSCVQKLKEPCPAFYKQIEKLMSGFNVQECSANSLLTSFTGIFLSVLIAYLV